VSSLERIGDEISLLLKKKSGCIDEVDKILTEKQINREMEEYRKMESKIAYWRNPNGKISDEDIQNARDAPMGELLNHKKGGSLCCPFHDDKHPSAAIKNNRLHCFVCNQTWDSIEVARKIKGMGFIEAVRFLIEK